MPLSSEDNELIEKIMKFVYRKGKMDFHQLGFPSDLSELVVRWRDDKNPIRDSGVVFVGFCMIYQKNVEILLKDARNLKLKLKPEELKEPFFKATFDELSTVIPELADFRMSRKQIVKFVADKQTITIVDVPKARWTGTEQAEELADDLAATNPEEMEMLQRWIGMDGAVPFDDLDGPTYPMLPIYVDVGAPDTVDEPESQDFAGSIDDDQPGPAPKPIERDSVSTPNTIDEVDESDAACLFSPRNSLLEAASPSSVQGNCSASPATFPSPMLDTNPNSADSTAALLRHSSPECFVNGRADVEPRKGLSDDVAEVYEDAQGYPESDAEAHDDLTFNQRSEQRADERGLLEQDGAGNGALEEADAAVLNPEADRLLMVVPGDHDLQQQAENPVLEHQGDDIAQDHPANAGDPDQPGDDRPELRDIEVELMQLDPQMVLDNGSFHPQATSTPKKKGPDSPAPIPRKKARLWTIQEEEGPRPFKITLEKWDDQKIRQETAEKVAKMRADRHKISEELKTMMEEKKKPSFLESPADKIVKEMFRKKERQPVEISYLGRSVFDYDEEDEVEEQLGYQDPEDHSDHENQDEADDYSEVDDYPRAQELSESPGRGPVQLEDRQDSEQRDDDRQHHQNLEDPDHLVALEVPRDLEDPHFEFEDHDDRMDIDEDQQDPMNQLIDRFPIEMAIQNRHEVLIPGINVVEDQQKDRQISPEADEELVKSSDEMKEEMMEALKGNRGQPLAFSPMLSAMCPGTSSKSAARAFYAMLEMAKTTQIAPPTQEKPYGEIFLSENTNRSSNNPSSSSSNQ